MHPTRKLPASLFLLPVLLAAPARGDERIAAAISQQPPAIDIATGSEIPSEGYCDQQSKSMAPAESTSSGGNPSPFSTTRTRKPASAIPTSSGTMVPCFFTETQKHIARAHRVPDELLARLWADE